MRHATFPCAGEGCTATVIQPVQGAPHRKCETCKRQGRLTRWQRYWNHPVHGSRLRLRRRDQKRQLRAKTPRPPCRLCGAVIPYEGIGRPYTTCKDGCDP